MKTENGITALVKGAEEGMSGEHETWSSQWSMLSGNPSVLEVSVPKELCGDRKGNHFRGAFAFTKVWPASKGGHEVMVYPEMRETKDAIVWSVTLKEGEPTHASQNNLCIVLAGPNGFTTREFSVVRHKDTTFLVYNMTYHGRFFRKEGRFFVPDLMRKNIVSAFILSRISDRWASEGGAPWTGDYRPWIEQIKFENLQEGELVVVAMATPIGQFYLRDRKGRHVTVSVDDVLSTPFFSPFPTVGMVCKGAIKEGQRLYGKNLEFVADPAERYGEIYGDTCVSLPDLEVVERSPIYQHRPFGTLLAELDALSKK